MSNITTSCPIPSPVNNLLSIFDKWHKLWSGYRIVNMTTNNSHNMILYIVGNAFNYSLDFFPKKDILIQVFGSLSKSVAIMEKTLCVVEQVKILNGHCDKIKNLYDNPFQTAPKHINLHKHFLENRISPAKLESIQKKINTTLQKIWELFNAFIQIISETWKLSMMMMDLRKTFSTDPLEVRTNIAESLLNGLNFFNLCKKMKTKEDQELTKWVLKKAETTSSSLITLSSKAFNGIYRVSTAIRGATPKASTSL
ncbi:MAG: hypothetical protein JHC93_05450 [Parachlamydiales bacterium]|nr:hypothetical protein [Parachlamydiales bacterium]